MVVDFHDTKTRNTHVKVVWGAIIKLFIVIVSLELLYEGWVAVITFIII